MTVLPAPLLFPFEPDWEDPVVATMLFATDIIVARNGSERRVPLRLGPRVILKWTIFPTTVREHQRFIELLWKSGTANYWQVPIWPSARLVTSVVSGDYNVTDMTNTDFVVLQSAVVWRSSSQCDVMTVNAIGADGVTLSGASTFDHTLPGTYVAPVLNGIATFPSDNTRFSGVGRFPVVFECDTTAVSPPTATEIGPSYRGVPILSLTPDGVDARETWQIPFERVAGDASMVVARSFADYPITVRDFSWPAMSYAEIAAMRAFLAARRGSAVPCWVPSGQIDLELSANSISTSNQIRIKQIYGYLPELVRRYILVYVGTDVLPFRIEDATDEGDGTYLLTLDSAVGRTLTPDNAAIAFLLYCRLSSDSIDLTYPTTEVATTTLSFYELPHEAAAVA